MAYNELKNKWIPGIERVQALTDISRSGYVVISTKPVHRLQIRTIVTTREYPQPFDQVTSWMIRVRAVVWECGEGQTDRQTDRQTHRQTRVIHFASSTTQTKRNKITNKSHRWLDGCIVWNAHNTVLGEEALLIYIVPVICYVKRGRYGKT